MPNCKKVITMTEYTLEIPDDLLNQIKNTAKSLNVTLSQFLLNLIKERISSFQSVEMYTDEDIAQWTQADNLSAEKRQHILQKAGVSFD